MRIERTYSPMICGCYCGSERFCGYGVLCTQAIDRIHCDIDSDLLFFFVV